MNVDLRNIPGWPESPFYSQVSIADGKLVQVAGQTGTDKDGKAADGLRAQTTLAMAKVAAALAAADAELTSLTVYVKGWKIEDFEELGPGLAAGAIAAGFQPVPATLIGVESLWEWDHFVEISATGVA